MQKNNHLNLNSIPMILIFLLGFSSSAFAATYKWVDADGNTHYTQFPPPNGIETKVIKSPTAVDVDAAQELLRQQQKKADSYQEQRKKLAEEKAKQKAEAELESKNCEIARSNLASIGRPRVNLVNEQGETYRVPEEGRLERLKKARADVAEHCK